MDTKSIYQPGFIHGEISHEIFMHKKLSKNKRDLYGLHKNMVIALAPIFSSYLKSTFRIDDLFPATNTMIKRLCIYVVMYLHVFSELHKEKVYERQYLL